MFNWPDTFSVVEMTDAVNKLPLMPLRFSGMFETYGLPTTHMAFDCKRGRIILISDSPRDADPEYVTGQTEKRETKILSCTHLSQADTLAPEDLQDVRAFGSTEPATVESVINDTFGVTQKKQNLSFPAAVEADKNPILSGIMAAKRKIEAAMGGNPFTGISAVIGSNAYDMLTSHALVRDAYNLWAANQSSFGDNDYRRRGFPYGGILWIEASDVVGGRKLVDDDKGHLYPTGPGIWKMYHAPANWVETVNTRGLPFYARMDERGRGRGYDLEVQSNPLTICMFPEALVELTFKAA